MVEGPLVCEVLHEVTITTFVKARLNTMSQGRWKGIVIEHPVQNWAKISQTF